MPQGYLTQQQAANNYGVTDRTIRNWISKGFLPGYRLGPRRVLVRQDDIEKMFRTIPATRIRSGVNYGPNAKIVDMRNIVFEEDKAGGQ